MNIIHIICTHNLFNNEITRARTNNVPNVVPTPGLCVKSVTGFCAEEIEVETVEPIEVEPMLRILDTPLTDVGVTEEIICTGVDLSLVDDDCSVFVVLSEKASDEKFPRIDDEEVD